MFLDWLIENYLILILAVIATFLIVLLFLTSYKQKVKKVVIKNQFDENFSETLLHSLGNVSNLKSISIEHKRLKVLVKDLKKVDAASLRNIGAPAILKGLEITILVKNHPNQVYQYINEKIKGV
jgi:phosphotransferase system IIB component